MITFGDLQGSLWVLITLGQFVSFFSFFSGTERNNFNCRIFFKKKQFYYLISKTNRDNGVAGGNVTEQSSIPRWGQDRIVVALVANRREKVMDQPENSFRQSSTIISLKFKTFPRSSGRLGGTGVVVTGIIKASVSDWKQSLI